jgi:hypothetical protein
MKLRVVFQFLISILLAFCVSGCVYQRLDELRKQFTETDKNFEIKNEHGLIIKSLHPVLLAEDVLWLGFTPNSKKATSSEEIWTYRWEKIYPENIKEQGNFDWISTATIRDGKICEVHFSDKGSAIFPDFIVLAMLEAAGKARVNLLERKLEPLTNKGSILTDEQRERLKSEVPTLDEGLRKLGVPFQEEQGEETKKLIYEYKIVHDEKDDVLKMTLEYNLKTLHLKSVLSEWSGEGNKPKSFKFTYKDQ